MRNKYYKKNRVKHLEYEFGETNLNSKEIVSKAYRSEINRKYKEKQDIFIIDSVLSELDNHVRKMVKEEVYQICNSVRFKELCYNCPIEEILSYIILYVWKTRNKTLKEDKTHIWKKHNLSWRRYALILGRLLQKTRENTSIK